MGQFQRAGSEIDGLVKWYVHGSKGKAPPNWRSTNKAQAYWSVLQFYLDQLQSRQVFQCEAAHVWSFLGGLRRISVGFTPHLIIAVAASQLHLIQFYTSARPGNHNNKPTQKQVQDVKAAGAMLAVRVGQSTF